MKKESPFSGSFLAFRPPTEFALARHTLLDSAHSSTTIARKRVTNFSDLVLQCGDLINFARTYFENNLS